MGPIDLQALLRRLAGNRPTRSIRQLLTRLVLSIMVPLLAFSALVLWRFTELQQQRAEQEALAAATALASDIDRDIRGILAALTGLASSPALLSDDFATFYVQAQQVATAVGVPILLRDGASGQQVLNTRLPFGAELPLNDPSGIATRVVASRVPYVSNLVFGTVAQKQLVAVAVPVMRGSDVVAVLIASVEGGRIGAVMAEQRLPDMWTLAVSDRDGMIIARSKDADAFIGRRSNLFDANSGRQGVHRVTNLEGIVVLRGYRHTEQGWLVASFTPLRFVNGPLRESWLAFVAIGVVLFALALPLTLYFAGRIAQSIREIADRAAALERGDAMPPIRTNIMEVAVVSELMNATATTLRNRELLLAESAARFRSAFEQAAVGFAQTGLDGRWIAVNSRFCELLGRSQSDCLELTAAAVTPSR